MAIALLGPLKLGSDAALGPRDRVVLAALALHPGDVVSAERLADALWGERPPLSWLKVVQGCVMRLRKVLGPPAIQTTPHGYRLAVPVDDVDAQRFEGLVARAQELLTLGEPERAAHVAGEALALWRGRALVELEGWDPGRIEAARLEELRRDAEELRLDADLRAGRHREVLAEAQVLVAEAPLRERRWALLALAQYQTGRQGEALRSLHGARTVLASELGLDPGPDLVALEAAILRQEPSLAAEAALPEPSPTCPYLGLVPYDVADSDAFFGRDADVAACLQRLASVGVLAVVGASGSGKSSLVRAGVAAALGRHGRRVAVVTPGAHPMDALTTLPGEGPAPVLVVDQCEEAITLCDDPAERARFLAALAAHTHEAWLVVAFRADRLGELSAYPGFARLIEPGLYLLGAMGEADLHAAIQGPAHQSGLLLEAGLVELLAREVEGEPGALPLLSHALRTTWQRREGRTLTVAGYRNSGGIRGAVAQSAEQLYDQVPPDQRPLVRDLLLRLVAPRPEGEPVRNRVPRRMVATDPTRERLIERLVAARLVTSDDGVVELAHEALARAWPRLRDWLDDDVAGQRILRHLTQAADTWDAMGRPDGELYRGPRLAQALDWRERTQPDLTPIERAFVEASQVLADAEQQAAQSRARHQARQNRRLRALLAGVGVLLVAALVAGLVAVRQRDRAQESVDQAREADAVQLGAQALVEEDLALSLLLARQAVAIDDTPETRRYLLAALLRAPAAVGIMHGHSNGDFNAYYFGGSAVSPDGKTLAVAAPGGWLDFFDARTYQQVGEPLRVPGGVGPIAYSPDGQTLAFGKGANIRLIDAHTREQLAEMRTDANAAIRLAFTKDGSQLAVLESEGEGGSAWITIRDATTLRPIGSPIQPDGFAGSWISGLWTDPTMALTPDGRSLVTTSAEGEVAWWDLQSRLKTRTLRIGEGYRALALSPDGLTAAIGLEDGIQLIDLRTGAVQEARGALASTPIWLLFSPDGNTVVSTSRDATITLWDAGSVTPRETWRGHLDSVQQPAFSPDGETLYTTGHDGTAIAWDMSRERHLGRPFTFTHDQGLPLSPGHPGKLSPDGQLIAVGLTNQGIGLWDAGDLTETGAPLLETGGEVMALTFSPDGQTLAAVARNGMATVWDVRSRSLRQGPFAVDPGLVIDLSISADGTMLATGGADGVKLWDVATGAALGRIGDDSPAGHVAFSPTEPLIAFVRSSWSPLERRYAEIWDVDRRSRITTLQLDAIDQDAGDEGDVLGDVLGWAVAFRPDGRTLATADIDPLVHLWDVRTDYPIRVLDQNVRGLVLTLEFSPDGTILAVAGGNSPASLWDVATGAQTGPWSGFTVSSHGSTIDLSSDGRRLLMTQGGKGAVWDIDPESWARRACALANRTLTRTEWEEFLPGRPYEPACST